MDMNVNTTPTVDTSKATVAVKGKGAEAVDKSESADDHQGFFDKLISLMFGGAEDESVQVTGKPDAKGDVKSDVKSEGKSAVSADDLLKQALTDKDGKLLELSVKQLLQLDSSQLTHLANSKGLNLKQLEQAIAAQLKEKPQLETFRQDVAAAKAEPSAKEKTAQVMAKGSELLGKLQQANQTLTKGSDGNSLPLGNEHSAIKVSPQSLVKAGQHNGQDESKPEIVLSKQELSALKQWQALHSSSATAEATDVLAEKPITEQELAQLIQVKKEHPELTDDQLKQLLVAKREQEQQQAALPQVEAQLGALAAGHMTPQAQELAALSDKQKIQLIQEAAARQGQHLSPAALQQALQQLNQGENKTALAAQLQSHSATHVAQQVDSNQTVAGAFNPAAGVNLLKEKALNESALKEALGAKALAGVTGKNSVLSGKESQLANQLAAAAGGQGLHSLQQLQRADGTQQAQQVASSPLQLSKDSADQLAERVQMMMSKNLKSVDIRLDPPELGRLHIKMNMHNDGGASVHFTVANQHARDALEQSMPRLREMMSQQGVQLGGTSVQQHSGGGQQQQQSFASGNGQTNSSQLPGQQENLDGDVKVDLNVTSKRDGISYYA
ncbi:flagellar hook-length control protein FliK [Vibrio sp. NFV-1]|uniref:Flagellar hook-length control protein FliK n=2 Tax=Vibrio nitrifigilis TaxID=2789781 RepID=A0ABS0GAQ8_9VIBR|nr:flagellar hook-length control protein FliK [Vibrio nitrifigilis]